MRDDRERLSGDIEINLVELVRGVWRQKVWAVALGVPIFIAGVAYALLAKPEYEAKLFIQPPSQNDIAQLNYGRGGDTGLGAWGVKDVYEIYLRALLSESVRNRFFRSVYLPSLSENERNNSRDMLYRDFDKVLKVALAAKDTPTRYVVKAYVEDPQQAAQWVSVYTDMAADHAKHELLKSSRSEMLVMADNIERQITSARASARKEREDEIARLKESLIVAKSIGLKKPPLISGALSTEVSAGMTGSLNYMRGSEALEMEIANLQSRPSDDPFISGLRKKQEALVFYRNLRVDPAIVSVYQQDGVVEQPDSPIKPKRVLIVVLTALMAAILGVFVALMREQWLRVRQR